MQTLTIPGTFPGLNALLDRAKTHWSNYRHLKSHYTRLVTVACRKANLPPLEGRTHIAFAVFAENRRVDPDNYAAGVHKVVLDGLVKAGVLPDDGWRYVGGLSDAFAVDAECPRVEITLTPMEEK